MRTSQKTLEPIAKDRGRTPSHYLIGRVQDRDLLDAAMLDGGSMPQSQRVLVDYSVDGTVEKCRNVRASVAIGGKADSLCSA
jgi:hypothetical protein